MNIKRIILPPFPEVKQLGELMTKSQHLAVSNHIKEWLQKTKCPFTTALDILNKSIYKNSSSKSISKIVATNLLPYNTDNLFANKTVKRKLAQIIINFSMDHRKFLVESFRLDQPDLLLVKNVAQQYLIENNFNKFFVYHELFKLHDPELTERVFLPSVADGDFTSVLRYIRNSEMCQVHIMEAVDRMFGDTYYLNSFRKYPANTEFKKSLEKFLSGTLKKNFPTSYSKAKLTWVNRIKILKQLDFYFLNYYWKKNDFIVGSSLEDLVFRYVGNNSEMLREVANTVGGRFKDQARAYLLSKSLQPGNRQLAIWSNDKEKPVSSHQIKLTIPIENVVIIDTSKNLDECLKNYFSQANKDESNNLLPVGFDAEWISSPTDMTEEDLALIQLAVEDHIFLIDVLQFQFNNQMKNLNDFLKNIFQSDHLLPLSFGTYSDAKVLGRYFPDALWSQDTNFIDFMQVRGSEPFDQVCGKDLNVCPHTGKKLTGLSRFCNQVSYLFIFLQLKVVHV